MLLVALGLSLHQLLVIALPQKRGDCSCGYRLSGYDEQYYPFGQNSTFVSYPNGAVQSTDAISDQGWIIQNGVRVGGTYNETTSYAVTNLVSVEDGIMILTFPGDQKEGANLSASEIRFKDAITGGVLSMDAQYSGVDGTCQAFVSGQRQSPAENSTPITLHQG